MGRGGRRIQSRRVAQQSKLSVGTEFGLWATPYVTTPQFGVKGKVRNMGRISYEKDF